MRIRERLRRRLLVVCLLLPVLLVTAQCGTPQPPRQHGENGHDRGEQSMWHNSSVPHLRPDVIRVLPHDPSSFTQGLALDEGILYESTGKRGQSVVRAVRFATGETLHEVPLPDRFFGEGIAVLEDRIWQLTWKAGVAFHRQRSDLDEIRRVDYSGQGWGLCSDGERLIMSDGSARLTFRDPESFAVRGGVTVRLGGHEVGELNELECAGGSVWANVWQTDRIVRIDPASGRVTAIVDASGLLAPRKRADAGVLNGIAAIDGTRQFLLTGKYWPHMYRVRFVPSG